MRKPATILIALGTTLAFAHAFPMAAAAQEPPQEKPAATESPVTLTEATRPDKEMLVEAVRMTPTHLEEFLAVADEIATVELVDVGDLAAGNDDLIGAVQERQAELELLRAALGRSETIATALEEANVSPEDVVAVQVIRGDVVEVVLYHLS